ncbi:MAG: recombinase family protein [Patescibacteria group bacterium]
MNLGNGGGNYGNGVRARARKRSVVYARNSTPFRKGGGHGLIDQVNRCMLASAESGYEVVNVFQDLARGVSLSRKNLERLFGFCFNPINNVSAVVITTQDRLSQNPDHYQAIAERLACLGIDLIVVDMSMPH